MTADAEDWSAHDLDHRFNLGRPRDEITGLAATLDHLLERIAASRRHEQQFAADVAHELRTPLAAIRGHAELGTAEACGTELAAIAVQAERMAMTIDTLLAHARRELDPRDGSVDLRAVLAEFDGVEVQVEPSLLLAEGDRGTVRRAIAPLIDNARRHTRGESVRVELASVQDRVCVVVRDDGPGVDPTIGDRVFDPGVRGPAEPGGGAGLGLPLARRLAQSCGGDVHIGPGPGGCFILDLPARHE
jgi:signal transduction histidine kinase